MARSCWKPAYISRSCASRLYLLADRLEVKFTRFCSNVVRATKKAQFIWQKEKLVKACKGSALFGIDRRLVIVPERADSILRLACRAKMWGDFNTGTSSTRLTAAYSWRCYRYFLCKEMLLEKFGTFYNTRSCGGYRCQKDKQKIQKFKKDIVKEKKKQVHVAREHARLMEKALKEEKVAKRAKRTGRSAKGKK